MARGKVAIAFAQCYNDIVFLQRSRDMAEKDKTYLRLPEGGPFITKDKNFYRTFLPLLVMITLRSLAALAVNLADNVMLGRYTEAALSGATVVNQLQFVLQQMVGGLGAGMAVLGSQYWGKKETEPIRKITGIGIKISLAVGILFFLVSALAPEAVLHLFADDAAVLAEAQVYLSLMCWTYLIFSVSNSLMYALQSVETAMVGTVMSLSTIVINVCLNYCLIYGHFGFPELGIRGAAVATLTSRTVELIIILVYSLTMDKKLRLKVKDLLGFDRAYLPDFFRAALPLLFSGLMWGIAQAAQAAILGHLDAAVISANSIAGTIFQLCAVLGMSAGSAASVVMGKTVGEGRWTAVKPYTRTLQLLFVCFGLLASAGIFLVKDWVIGFYSISESAKAYAGSFMTVMGITCIGSCYEFPCMGGIIAGGGDPKYQAIIDNAFMWFFTIPVAAVFAYALKLPPLVVFCALKADKLIKCIPNFIVTNRYRWVRALTRET